MPLDGSNKESAIVPFLRALCIASWGLVGLIKLFSPSPVYLFGITFNQSWGVLAGLFECVLAALFLLGVTRPWARLSILFLLALFVVNWLWWDRGRCGCLGVIKMERSRHAMLIGYFMCLHGLEIMMSGKIILNPLKIHLRSRMVKDG